MNALQSHATQSPASVAPRLQQGWLELHRESHGPRRRPRAEIDVPVRVSGAWNDGQGAYVPVLGRCRDLSETGMALWAPVTLEVGSPVTCSLRLDGSPVYLQGKVMWRRRPLSRQGQKLMGIQFTEASDADRSSLRRVLARANLRKAVRLRFPDSPDAVLALADIDDGELNVVAPLSLFRIGKPVQVSFDAGGPSYEGEVAEVQLDQRGDTPTLRARIRVGDTQLEAFRGTVREVAREDVELAEKRQHRRRLSAVLWAGALGFATGAALWAFESHRPPRLALSVPGTRDSAAVQPAPVTTPAVHIDMPPRMDRVRRVGPQPQPVSMALQTERDAATDPFVAPPAPTPPPVTAPTEAPYVVRRETDGIEVELPSALAPEVLRHFRLAEPPGVGVDLRAPLHLPEGRYPINRDGVRWLRVQKVDGRTLVRLYLQAPPSDYSVESLASQLRLWLGDANR